MARIVMVKFVFEDEDMEEFENWLLSRPKNFDAFRDNKEMGFDY